MHVLSRCWPHAAWCGALVLCAACNSSTRLSNSGETVDGSPPGDDIENAESRETSPPSKTRVRDEPPAERASPIRITEIHYHPGNPGAEFIELANASSELVSLRGWKITRGVRFAFPADASLAPGAVTLVAQNAEKLRRATHGAAAVAGEYSGRLDNAGELVRLKDHLGHTVADVRYGDAAPWPQAADGDGASLQRVSLERDIDDAANWRAGSPTPGVHGATTPARAHLSLFDVRCSPRRPRPGETVEIMAAAFHVEEPELSLHYVARGERERSISMHVTSSRATDGGRETRFAATVPAHPASTVVRYWITAHTGRDRQRAPVDDAAVASYAYFVEPAATDTTLPVYHLFIDPGALSRLQRNARSNQLHPATFVHDGRVHQNVRVRARGSWARSWPKKSWKIFFPKGARFSKRSRINLNSAWRDASFIREPLAYEIYQRSDALSLRARMVRLEVNGRFWGLFVDVEQPKKRYLSRQGIPGAVLYKADSSRNQSDERLFRSAVDYRRHYQNETHPDDTFEELRSFCGALASARDVVEFFETHVDLPRYINYLCASTLTQNWDAFNKNHFIAHDREGTGKWYVIPWDVDRTLGDHWNWSFDSVRLPLLLGTSARPGATGWNRMADRFFGEPELKKRFMDRLAELLETTFTEEKLLPYIDELARSIATEAELDRSRWGGHRDWRGAVETVRSFVRERRRFLLSRCESTAAAR